MINKPPEKVKINEYNIMLTLAMIAYFEPRIIDQLAFLKVPLFLIMHRLFTIIKYFSFLYFSVYYLFKNRLKVGKMELLTMLYLGVLLIATIYYKGSISSYVAAAYPVFFFVIIAKLSIIKDELVVTNKIIFYWGYLLVVINLLTVILFPEGLYIDYRGWRLNWILGNYQQNVAIFLPTIFSGFIVKSLSDSKSFSNKYRIAIISMLITTILTKSKTTYLMFFVLFVLKVNLKYNWIQFVYKGAMTFYLSMLASLSIIQFKLHYHFQYVIEVILKKNMTLSGRETIWGQSLEAIKKHPILGVGIQTKEFNEMIFSKSNSPLRHPHNQYLYILYLGGIVLFLVFCYFTIRAMNKNYKYLHLELSQSLYLGLTAYFVMFLTESWNRGLMYYFFLLTFAFEIERIIKNTERSI